MTAMPWFRLFTEARKDSKLRLLADDEHRVWFDLLCFAAEQTERGTIPIDGFVLSAEVAGGDEALLVRTIVKLVGLGLVSRNRFGDLYFLPSSSFDFETRAESLRPPASVWCALRSTIFIRDDFTCHYCGARGVRLECDHVIPVSRGGTNDPANLVAACRPCNRSKRARLVEEWLP